MAIYSGVDDMINRLGQLRSQKADRQNLADSRTAMFKLNVGPNYAGALGAQSAPFSGYMDDTDYRQGLENDTEQADLTSRLKGGPGQKVVAGRQTAGVPMRASMAALRDDPNAVDPAPTFEQLRQRKVLGEMDADAENGINADRVRNSANFDLGSGQAAARAHMAGNIGREEELENARNKAAIEFDPTVKRARDDAFYEEMQKLRTRYQDPALAKAQGEQAVAGIRAQGGIDREVTRGEYGNAQTQTRADATTQAAGTRANAQIGAAVAGAGGNPDRYTPGYDPNAKSMSQDELQSYAADNGMSVAAAAALAKSHGYVIR